MKISKDSLLYQIWELTFAFSLEYPPALTTSKRFWVRIIFMPPLLVVFVVSAILYFVIQTVIVNVVTVLSGVGVCVTWDDGSDFQKPHIRRFEDVSLGKGYEGYEIPVWTIVLALWAVLALSALWYWHLDTLFNITSAVVGIVAIFLVSAFTLLQVDDKEKDDFSRLQRIIQETVRNGKQPKGVLSFYSAKDMPKNMSSNLIR